MPISKKGDIPEEDEVRPVGNHMVDIVQEIVDSRGGVHAYLPNHRDTESDHDDIHIDGDLSYVWPDVREGLGLIYVMNEDVERWIAPEDILYLEKHN